MQQYLFKETNIETSVHFHWENVKEENKEEEEENYKHH